MNVAVNRLTLKGACEAPHHQAFLIEDALNTQLSGENRLVLVRTLSLLPVTSPKTGHADGRMVVAGQVASGWSRVMAHSCHGGSDGAACANVVWFVDLAEAKSLLLARLLKGQTVDAWYWRLAIKYWHRQPLAQWIADELADDDVAAPASSGLSLIMQVLEAGDIATAEAAITRYLKDEAVSNWHFGATEFPLGEYSSTPTKPARKARDGERVDAAIEATAAGLAATCLARIPHLLVALLRELNQRYAANTMFRRLVRQYLVRAAPELGLEPILLRHVAQHMLMANFHMAILTTEDERVSTGLKAARVPLHLQPKRSSVPLRNPAATKPNADTEGHVSAGHKVSKPETAEPIPARRIPVHAAAAFAEQPTASAGLFFLFNILRELDWPKWLITQPDWLGQRPTAQLLLLIAQHHKIGPNDAAILTLQQWLGDTEPVDPDLLRLWRVGLDRWLRRNVSINLATLVHKAGWLRSRDDRIDVRFRTQQVDMRLRRLALDRDPGWIDWAGLSLRFHYCDEPLLKDGVS
jgi:hypothetical protein